MIIAETYATPNKGTKSGNPPRWRWRITDVTAGRAIAKSRGSFRNQDDALTDLITHGPVPDDATLRQVGHKDRPWRNATALGPRGHSADAVVMDEAARP